MRRLVRVFSQGRVLKAAAAENMPAPLPKHPRVADRQMRFREPAAYWAHRAKAWGFTAAVTLRGETLQSREDVRQMCAADKCRAYGKNWTCPPHCGTLEACGQRLKGCSTGILVQTTGQLSKTVDTKGYRRVEEEHLRRFYSFCRLVREQHPGALCLGSGGCRICGECAWPESCRNPKEAVPSMEAYGLFVTQVCRENGLAYHYGEKTVTYTACILF